MSNFEVVAHQVTDPDAYPSTHSSTHEDARGSSSSRCMSVPRGSSAPAQRKREGGRGCLREELHSEQAFAEAGARRSARVPSDPTAPPPGRSGAWACRQQAWQMCLLLLLLLHTEVADMRLPAGTHQQDLEQALEMIDAELDAAHDLFMAGQKMQHQHQHQHQPSPLSNGARSRSGGVDVGVIGTSPGSKAGSKAVVEIVKQQQQQQKQRGRGRRRCRSITW